MDDTSLDDFVTESEEPADSPEDGDGESGQESGADDPATTEVATESVADPSTTMRFVPDGEGCPACGATVRRLWTDGDTAVCRACKEW